MIPKPLPNAEPSLIHVLDHDVALINQIVHSVPPEKRTMFHRVAMS